MSREWLYFSKKCTHTRIVHRRGEVGYIQRRLPSKVDRDLVSMDPFLILGQGGRDALLRRCVRSTSRETANISPNPFRKFDSGDLEVCKPCYLNLLNGSALEDERIVIS